MSSTGEESMNHTDFISAENSLSLPLWSRITYLCIVSVLAVISITGNGLILTVEYNTKKKTSTDWLVASMAALDFATSIIEISTAILFVSGFVEDIHSDALCGAINYLRSYTQFTSCLLLTTISIERYFKTCKPHSTAFSPKMTIYLCIGITLVSSLFNVPVIPLSIFQAESFTCRMTTVYDAAKTMFGITLGASFIVMIAALIVMYTKIAIAMKKRIRQFSDIRIAVSSSANNTFEMKEHSGRSNTMDKNRSRSDSPSQQVNNSHIQYESRFKHTHRISFIMCLLTTVFILTLLPGIAVGMLFANRQILSIKEHVVTLCMRTLPSVNTVTNPIFFILMSSKFRQQSKVVLLKRYQATKTLFCR